MDHLVSLVRIFDALDDNVDEVHFGIQFMRMMNQFIDVIEEALIDQHNVRDTNEFYVLICSSLANLKENLNRYAGIILKRDAQQMSEEQAEE